MRGSHQASFVLIIGVRIRMIRDHFGRFPDKVHFHARPAETILERKTAHGPSEHEGVAGQNRYGKQPRLFIATERRGGWSRQQKAWIKHWPAYSRWSGQPQS